VAGHFSQNVSRLDNLKSGSQAPKRTEVGQTIFPGNEAESVGAILRSIARAVIVDGMSAISQLLHAIEQGEPHAADQLLPLVYDELRLLAAQKLAQERPGQTLQPTALVHEAYLRLVGDEGKRWDGRGHFFAAAGEAMRRILVESARHKNRLKHGGDRQRVELEEQHLVVLPPPERMIELDEALTQLAAEDPAAAEVVKLHFFAGLSLEQVAECLGVSRATAYRQWAYARAWLRCALGERDGPATS
jgi:RNA polymerase sigma factor (TIGR02999 family)